MFCDVQFSIYIYLYTEEPSIIYNLNAPGALIESL
jgi:hypothetical protein